MKKTNLFIVGEPKCGTTALIHFLGEHPDIFTTEFEVGAFATDEQAAMDKWRGKKKGYHISRSKKLYKKMFRNAKDEKILGEATTGNLFSRDAAKNIYHYNPEAKIIMMFRNPVDYLYSLHSQYVVNLDEPVKDFRKALALEKMRKRGKDVPEEVPFPARLYYSEWTRFSEHAKRYLKVFPKKKIKIIIYDDFKKDNSGVYKEVLDFLGVDSGFKPRFGAVNPNKVVRSEFLKRLTDRMRLWFWVKNYLPPYVSGFVAKTFHRLFFRVQKRKPLSQDFRKSLMKKYKPEVVRLSRLLKRDFVKEWGYDNV